jgi:tetratricopeptide (TPR) repeat protein
MLEERGGLDRELPDSVQAIIAARLDSLPADEKRLLLDAAVLGRTFWVGALADHGRAEEQLRALQRKEFVRRERRSTVEGETEFAFAHMLVCDVAYAQIPRAQRAEKHARAARWIEALSADRSEDLSELLAHHYLAALELVRAVGGDISGLVEPAIAALADATERALSLSAFAQAERSATELLALLPDADERRPKALFRLAAAEFELGGGRTSPYSTVDEAIVRVAEAAAAFAAGGDAAAAAEAEIAAADWLWNLGRRDEAHAASERALALVEGSAPSRVKAAALVERSRLLMLASRNDESVQLGRAGLELAERFGDEALQARALITIGTATSSAADLRRGIEIADRVDAVRELVRGNNNLAEQMLARGDLAEVEALYDAVAVQVERVGMVTGVAWLEAQAAAAAYLTGDWARSERLYAKFLAVVEQTKTHALEAWARAVGAMLAEARGDPVGASALWERALELAREMKDPQQIGPVLSGRARFLLSEGRVEEATAHVDEVLALRDEQGQAAYFTWLIDLGWLLHDLGRGDELPPARKGGVWLAAAQELARGEFAVAADVLGESGFRTEEAYARLRAAEQLAQDGRGAEAAAQRDRALAFYRGVGASAYVRRAEALLAESA